MRKPNDYDDTKIGRDFIPVNLGGHKARIMQVEEMLDCNKDEMILVSFDFAQEDAQASYMAMEYRNDIRPNKKWPITGRWYCHVYNHDKTTNSEFKKFIVNWENSNGKKINWNAPIFGAQFKNDKIGAVFGEVDDLNAKGELKTYHKLRWWCEYDKAIDATVPDKKPYKPKGSMAAAAPAVGSDGFMAIPEGINDAELPFN